MHGYKQIGGLDDLAVHGVAPEDKEMEAEMKRKALKEILNRIFGGDQMFDNHKIEECMENNKDWIHDRYSLPDKFRDFDKEDDLSSEPSVHPFSYPISPRTRAKIEEPMFPLSGIARPIDDHPDNVY